MDQYLLPNVHGYLYDYRYGRFVEEYRREISYDDYDVVGLRLQKHTLWFHDRICVWSGYQGKPHLQHYYYDTKIIYNGMTSVGKHPINYLYTYEDPDWLRKVVEGSKN